MLTSVFFHLNSEFSTLYFWCLENDQFDSICIKLQTRFKAVHQNLIRVSVMQWESFV